MKRSTCSDRSNLARTQNVGTSTKEVIVISDGEEMDSGGVRRSKKVKLFDTTTPQTIDLTFDDFEERSSNGYAQVTRRKGKERASTSSSDTQGADGNGTLPIQTTVESVDLNVSLVLEVVKDVDPDYARSLLSEYALFDGLEAVSSVISNLLEEPYPKNKTNDEKGRKSEQTNCRLDSKDRPFTGGQHYKKLAIVCFTIFSIRNFFFCSIDELFL